MVNISALVVVVLVDRLATLNALVLARHCSAAMFGVYLYCVLCCLNSWAFPLIGPQCTVGVLAGTHWGAHRYPGRMVSGTKRQPSGCCSSAAADCCKLYWLCYHKHITLGRMRVSWISADLGSACSCVRHAREFSSFCTTLTTSGKLFDSTSKRKIPGCPHSNRHISLVVKVGKLIHLQTVG